MRLVLADAWYLLRARFRPPVGVFETTTVTMRVWPHHLDLQLFMNNGCHASLASLARWDFAVRSGVGKVFQQRRWTVVVAAQTIRYKRSLKLWTRFTIESRFHGIHDGDLLLESRFVVAEKTVTTVMVRCRVVRLSGGSVPEQKFREAFPELATAPPVPEWAASAVPPEITNAG
jgi:acyl-CoA thioesterase FadM